MKRNLKKDFIIYMALSAIGGFGLGMLFFLSGDIPFSIILLNVVTSAVLGGIGGILGYLLMMFALKAYTVKLSPTKSGLKNYGVNYGKNFIIKKLLIMPFIAFPFNITGMGAGILISFFWIFS